MLARIFAPLLVTLAIACCTTTRARAESPEDLARARELFVEGAKLAEAGSWEQAREKFARSLEKKRAALTLYNLGVAQEETGRLTEAVGSFRARDARPILRGKCRISLENA